MTYKQWTPEQIAEYREKWQNNSGKELMAIYNVSQKTITNINRHYGFKMKTGVDASGNPIKKNYRTRKDAYPVGTVTYHFNRRLNKKLALVITEKGRVRLHIWRWLQAGNEIPEGYVLGHKDLNPENDEMENLVLKTRGEIARGNNLKAYPVEKRKAGLSSTEGRSKPAKIETRRFEAVKKEERTNTKADDRKAKEARENRLKVERDWQERSRRNRKVKRMETRPLDLSAKIAVKLNSKTTIYVNPGADIEQIKRKYLKAS